MANYYVLLTDYGKSFIANAQANSQLALTHVVLGDANGQPYLPDSRLTHTALLHQTAKLPVAAVKVISTDTAEVSAIVPSNVGGFNLHEVGITDSSGKLVYVGNFHGGYRPTLTEGAGGDMELIFTIRASNLATVIIEANSQTVVATRDWVTEHFITKPELQAHLDDADPHPQYALLTLVQEYKQIIDELKDELMSTQYQLLSERLTGVEQQIKAISATTIESIKVGDVYVTTLDHANAAAVAKHHGYGVWERTAEGRALVGLSKKSGDIAEYKTIGTEFGENTHTLTIDEMPKHKHSHSEKYQYYIARHHRGESVSSGDFAELTKEWQLHGQTEAEFAAALDETRGNDQPHNNIPPSVVVAVWRRTA